MRLLIVEDDDRTGSYLARGLSESGHIVDRAADGELGLALASEGIYDALVVDRRLPAMDGLTLIRRLRQRDTITPILVLSAIGGTADRIEGMRAGCDDYLAKPYAFAEVLARLEALVRRADRALDRRCCGSATWRSTRRAAGRRGAAGTSTCSTANFCCWHSSCATPARSSPDPCCWRPPGTTTSSPGNIIDMHVHRLRQKVDEGFAYPLIHTVLARGT